MRIENYRAALLTWIVFGLAWPAFAQTPFTEIWSTTFKGSYPIAPGSTVIIDNRFGNVVVEGVGGNTLEVRARLTVRAVDEAAVREARKAVTIHSAPAPRGRMIRTAGNEPGRNRWAAIVDYEIRLPRNCNVAINTDKSDVIQTMNVTGSLQIQSFSGRIDITAPGSSAMLVDTTNGDIIVRLQASPKEDSRLKTLNGNVQIYSRRDLSFQWIAESMNGLVRWNRELVNDVVRPAPGRNRWTADINGGGKRIYSASMTGALLLAPLEDAPAEIRAGADRATVPRVGPATESEEIIDLVSRLLLQRPGARSFAYKRNRVPDRLNFETRLGNIVAVEVNEATLSTGAGEIVIGRATGSLEAVSFGGPVNIGETFGSVNLETHAGDVMINSANRGAHAKTGGGNIRVGRSGGPLRLISGGGDISVDEAGGDVIARTKSGDIRITIPGTVRSLHLDLKTTGGNVIITLPAGLAATVDATVVTSEKENHSIESTVAGLAIVRDVIGDTTRIRARGALNGGGPVLKIVAEQGNIRLRQSGAR